MPTPTKHSIDKLSVWIDDRAVRQAFTTLAARIIEARITADMHGREVAAELYGDDGGSTYPMAGEAVIGRAGGLVVKLSIEPEKGGWVGDLLEHEEVNAIGISDMVVDGQPLKKKDTKPCG